MQVNPKNKFNIIDAVIIIVILLLAATFIYRFAKLQNAGNEFTEAKISYTLTVNKIDADFAGKIKNGDTIYVRGLQYGAGTVKSVKSAYYSENVYLPDGTSEKHINPEFKTVVIEVETDARLSENEFCITSENFAMYIGKEIGCSNGNVAFNAVVTAFSAE